MKEKVNNLLNNIKSFEELVKVLDNIQANDGGYIIRGHIMDYMEENYPTEFEAWL